MSLSICIGDFLGKDLSILYGVDFKLFRMAKVLEYLAVFIGYCYFHFHSSLSRFWHFAL